MKFERKFGRPRNELDARKFLRVPDEQACKRRGTEAPFEATVGVFGEREHKQESIPTAIEESGWRPLTNFFRRNIVWL